VATAPDPDLASAGSFDDDKAMTDSPDVVGLPGDHLTHGLPLGVLELLALPPDPRQSLNDRQADLLVIEASGSCHADAADRRIHPDVKILDVLIDDIDVDAGDREMRVSGTHRVLSEGP
jgi:hypothetical protein